ncbi:siderophore ferric iron reductase [Arenibaculum pallidiluteum]|uniref:siderophore ferric iron reductase n=1 Tax=Arenibaculum pallidiluteum TaxID=2812559 RepID=UPI001A95CFB8|nr:siderophore ferric iron reductase [Arenibaculum pallidiluteum]
MRPRHRDADEAILRLLAAAEAILPGMVGEIGGHLPGGVTRGRSNATAISELVDAIRAQHPEAGRGYWALRAWGMLTWQPALLAVLAVHRVGIVPRLDGISQRIHGPSVIGYALPGGETVSGPPEMLIEQAGAHLRVLADDLLAELDAVIGVKPVLARRLLADRLMAMLPRLGEGGDGLENDEIRVLAALWLDATGLRGQSGLMAITLGDGREQLTLDRKACCLEYRRDGAGLCASCPRQSDPVRIQRMRDDWEAHLGVG